MVWICVAHLCRRFPRNDYLINQTGSFWFIDPICSSPRPFIFHILKGCQRWTHDNSMSSHKHNANHRHFWTFTHILNTHVIWLSLRLFWLTDGSCCESPSSHINLSKCRPDSPPTHGPPRTHGGFKCMMMSNLFKPRADNDSHYLVILINRSNYWINTPL